jgi:ribosome silencing factor RsfS/YbeB/iojap
MPNKAFVERSVDPMESKEKSLLCVQLARSRRAQDVVVLDLREMVSFADFFVLCTGRSDRQVQAIAEHLARELKPLKMRPRSVEGLSTGRWVLMDFEDVIVHVFQAAVREFYDLEGLWSDAPRLDLPPDLEEETRSAVPGEEPDE